uniref:Uncharacterized protein n=2 Tax=Tetraselmis sp. GSL018 TaxID=582737 RepID=A0A061R4S9_9CHLO|eukprot:CAMPEP_0177594678 /NCGR_PEP_ID=MMETSP0419_2-20121207/9912_1 /TAXON_ID=582737 /ORGANISM="Tetraselmis sp., Strain GSL018" /LENGTH=250 /DNA_ID=CAMNT_0019086009 /DNA_START=626 /DNA_END=1378 /DNA_ORIENTATION=+
MAIRVVGFAYAEDSARQPVAVRRRNCPVSPLGNLLQKHAVDTASSDDQTNRFDDAYDSDGYCVGDYSYESFDSGWSAVAGSQIFEDCYRNSTYSFVQPEKSLPQTACCSRQDAARLDVCHGTCSTCSDPIPIPPKPVPPPPSSPSKNIKRVPEPPMVKVVNPPEVVEQVYAEYERLKQKAIEEQMYQEMIASHGNELGIQRRRRSGFDKRGSGMELGTEMDKLSWRTIYTHLQSNTLPRIVGVASAAGIQ